MHLAVGTQSVLPFGRRIAVPISRAIDYKMISTAAVIAGKQIKINRSSWDMVHVAGRCKFKTALTMPIQQIAGQGLPSVKVESTETLQLHCRHFSSAL